MKKKYSKIIKTFSKAVFVCLVILCMILGIMFCSKFGQRILVDITTKYIESNGITCDINGLSKDLSKINDIFIKLADGTEIYISDVTISKNHFFEKADIHAKKLKLKTAKNSDKNLHKNNNLIADIKQSIFSYAQNFRFFIKKVTIGKAELNISEKKFHLNSIEYVSKKTDDNFQCNIFNKHYFLKCNLNWNAQSHINILFKKDEQNIFAINIKNIDTDISPITITLEKDKRIYNINGKIITKNNQIILFSKINTNDFLYALTLKNELKKHFENTFAIFNITCGFDKKIEFSVVIEKTKKIIGTLLGTINDNVINVKGKIDYNIYGYVFKNIDCEIIDFEKIYSNFIGENFDIKIAAKINNQQIEIENFIFNIPKNGFIKATKPFVVADDNKIYANFDFKLAQLAFWNKIIPISDGDANGTIVFNGDKIQTDCKGKSITFKKFGKLLNYSLSADGKNISLHAKNAIHINSIWQDLSFKTHQNKLKISGKINNFSSLVEGNISDSFKQITINKGTINSQHIICDIKHCDLDFDTDNYKILIETFNKKNKKGSLYFNNDNTSTIIELNSFQPHYMNNILGILIPQCRLDGKIKINKTKESKIGEAHITISDILSRKSSISLVSNLNKNGLTVKTVINNTEKTLKGDIFIPITFDKNNSIKNTNSIQINGHISGETYLERLFELPDRSDAKGLFSCNLYISGNLSDPKINGTASLKNGYFMIGDIFLRKGYITLQCDNNKINIVNAEFSDTKNNKLMASGTG
ncbi:MAG: hypothetical protein IJ730_07400, partial [Alphaproteobacteria bacterium]|nr:hypothetical protein [Alphaproteobacteria bacterium]